MKTNIPIQNISVIGLGKLGGSMAASFAHRGFRVIGVDINRDNVEAFSSGRAPVQETGLTELIAANQERLRATMSTEEAVLASDISFVIVPTPSDHRGAFTLQYAKHAFAELGRALRKKNNYHVIVMTSTVLPGSTRHGLLPILERESSKRCGEDFGLCYNPEFIALGSVIRDFLNPDFYLIGQFDMRSGDVLEQVHHRVSENQAPVKRLSLENAELAKISVNSFVTMKISFANMLAEFCEHLPGGDVDVVSDALGLDKRIGRKYLTGGLGFAGPCFPRDNVALNFMGATLGVDCDLLAANHAYNGRMSTRLMTRLLPRIPSGATIAVLGLAYKPLSHIVEESPGVALCQAFCEKGFRVIAHDRLAIDESRPLLHKYVLLTHSLEEALQDADVVVVTTTDEIYLTLSTDALVRGRKNVVLVDFWRALAHLVPHPNIDYIPSGRCLDDATATGHLALLWGN